MEAVVESPNPVSTNWLAPLVETPGGGDIGSYTDNRVLFVPWDNDHFIRYRADRMNGTGTSYETTAICDNASRKGLVVGSVTYDTWKTGIDYSGANDRLDLLKVYGGVFSKVTQDNMPHGQVSGTRVVSPRVFVGCYDDWRTGMEDFGSANSVLAPPLPWKGAAPLGWNSWAAYGCKVDSKTMMGVSDFIKSDLQAGGYHNGGVVYVNWDSACSSPLAYGEEYGSVAKYIKANGHHPGAYFSSFGVWAWGKDTSAAVMGTNGRYTWNDIFLRDANDNIIVLDGDHVIVGSNSPAEARSRASASAIAGLFLNSDRLADNAAAKARAQELLTRPGILELVRRGVTFRPLEGNTGERATDVFMLQDGSTFYLAEFTTAKPLWYFSRSPKRSGTTTRVPCG